MHKVDVLTDLPTLKFANMKSVEWLKMSFNDFNLSVCKLPTSTVIIATYLVKVFLQLNIYAIDGSF